MENYYTAAEAIKKLSIPRSTFYNLIKSGELPKGIILPLRKQAIYPKSDIDKIAREKDLLLAVYKKDEKRLKFMLPEKEDLIQLVDLDRLVFREETLILPEEQLARYAYNPEAIHVLKDVQTHMVLGGITLSPLKQSVLGKLISLEIDETEVKPEDYLPFTPGQVQDCYVIGVIAKPGLIEKYYAGKLLYGVIDYLIELLEKDVVIRHIYTVATTDDGERLAQTLGFQRLSGEWKALQGRYEEFRRPYMLDLEARESNSKIINKYLQQKKNLERRKKRYKKQIEH
jgi:predicted DNA-binding transcriptional regulator AlpA